MTAGTVDLAQEWAAWHAEREDTLREPHGWLSLSALHWLDGEPRAYPDLPATANVEAWLVTIAHRKAIDVRRADARRAVPVGELPERPAPATQPPDDEVWQALSRLPDKQRQTVAYHHVAGLPHREVAAIVGGSEAAARRSAADGIAALRRTLLDPTEGETS